LRHPQPVLVAPATHNIVKINFEKKNRVEANSPKI
jgi:hypothetical protein